MCQKIRFVSHLVIRVDDALTCIQIEKVIRVESCCRRAFEFEILSILQESGIDSPPNASDGKLCVVFGHGYRIEATLCLD
jgi:hypothetical protein